MKDTLIKRSMVRNGVHAGINKVLITTMLAVQLIACGGGGSGSGGGSTSTNATSAGTADIASVVKIGGSVGDGPVTGATIVVYAVNGDELGSMTSDSTASFSANIKTRGRDYPLLIKASGGIDLVTGAAPAFEMISVMSMINRLTT